MVDHLDGLKCFTVVEEMNKLNYIKPVIKETCTVGLVTLGGGPNMLESSEGAGQFS